MTKEYYPIADTTVIVKNQDGTFSVCDNGEEISGLDAIAAFRVTVENLLSLSAGDLKAALTEIEIALI